MVVFMCQYNDRCPTTRHRQGTQCPVEVRDRNREDKMIRQLWAAIGMLAVAAVMVGYYWFYGRPDATGLGFPPLDDLLLRAVSLPVMPPTWVR